jgi:hypothetical protein
MDQTLFDIELLWAFDVLGFHVTDGVSLNDSTLFHESGRVIRNGGLLQQYEPAKIPGLLDRFLDVRTPADILRFLQFYGPLTREGFSVEGGDSFPDVDGGLSFYSHEGEALDIGIDRAGWFRDLLSAKPRPAKVARILEQFKLEPYTVQIIPDQKSGMRMKFRPDDLLGFLTLSVLHRMRGSNLYSACLECGEFFAKGIKTGRRSDAQFCSDQHRVNFNSSKRSRR